MPSVLSTITAALGCLSLASAAPNAVVPRFACGTLAKGLTAADCAYMSSINMAGQGTNAASNNGVMWIGGGGPNTFAFTNKASEGVILIIWHSTDYSSSMMGAKAPAISYSLAAGASVTISMANGVSGAWSGIYGHRTKLNMPGQIDNTWGEFTTGQYGTIDISREINMAGNAMWAKVSTGCVADMNTCAYVCKSGNTCYQSGSYSLIGCKGKNTNAAIDSAGNPNGGCTGFSNGGHIDVEFRA